MTSEHHQHDILSDDLVAWLSRPGMFYPTMLSFSPNHRILTFLLPSHNVKTSTKRMLFGCAVQIDGDIVQPLEVRNLFHPNECEMDLDDDASCPLDEALRRERTRQDFVGVSQYAWGRLNDVKFLLLLPLAGNIWVKEFNSDNVKIRQIFDKSVSLPDDDGFGHAICPILSPDALKVAFVRSREIYVVSTSGEDMPFRITFDARKYGESIYNGLADFLAQEEMDRLEGFWWSPDSKYIAFEQVDESHVAPFTIVHLAHDEPATEEHRYPFAGRVNPRVRLGIAEVRPNPSILWLNIQLYDSDDDIYLARVDWFPDQSLAVQVQNRKQNELYLMRFDTQTGKRTILITEQSSTWINLHDLFVSFVKPSPTPVATDWRQPNVPIQEPDSMYFIWGSESSDFMHLYLYELVGDEVKSHGALTSGAWEVINIAGLDLHHGFVYFHATKDSPMEQHLYSTSIWQTKSKGDTMIHKLTEEPGFHQVVLDSTCRYMADVFSSINQPPVGYIAQIHASSVCSHRQKFYDISWNQYANALCRNIDQHMRPPSAFSVHSPMHESMLFGYVYTPDASIHGPPPYPLVVSVYGGPHVQIVVNQWDRCTNDMRAQRLAQNGFLVMKLDNHGSSRRGVQFRNAIHNSLGTVEICDQVEGVNYLVRCGLADPARVGVYGWSYGGYMSLMCLATRPDIFKVAIAGAPVTSWEGYDTHYTERYMGTPVSNPSGYGLADALNHVENIRGKLMIAHGLIDENVHFRHTAQLISRLNECRVNYDLVLFPEERHVLRKDESRIYLEKRIFEFLFQHLKAPSSATQQ